MSRRVERIRVGLIAGSVLLLMVLAGTYGLCPLSRCEELARDWEKTAGVEHRAGDRGWVHFFAYIGAQHVVYVACGKDVSA